MQKQLQILLQKEMTRREFLATLGFGLASVLGFSSVLKLLTSKSSSGASGHTSFGYGGSAYGGGKEAVR